MTFNFTSPVAKFSAALATGAMLLLSTTTASFAKKETVMVLDSVGGLYSSCALDIGSGSTYSETSTTFSCTTSGGQTTTCDKADDNPTLCGTDVVEESGRGTGGKSRARSGNASAPLSSGMSKGVESKTVPAQFIMQYSVQN